MGEMKQAQCWGLTNTRRHRTKASSLGDLAPRVSAAQDETYEIWYGERPWRQLSIMYEILSNTDWCKAKVYGRSLAGIAGSNPAGNMDVSLLWVLRAVR